MQRKPPAENVHTAQLSDDDIFICDTNRLALEDRDRFTRVPRLADEGDQSRRREGGEEMSDYQAIYDAVRSRISGGNIGEVVSDAARQAFDISHTVACLYQDFSLAAQHLTEAALQHQRPSAVYRPQLSLDGNQWCALYGDNIQEGIAGFGDTPELAMRQFDEEWLKAIPPKGQKK